MMAELLGAVRRHGDGVFRCSDDGARWLASGELTYANAARALAAARALPLPTTGDVDCTGIVAADSAAVAVLLALKRRAAQEGGTLRFTGTPGVLAKLADLYGVEELLRA
jgi:phospholipid transport system transporter-binding protein